MVEHLAYLVSGQGLIPVAALIKLSFGMLLIILRYICLSIDLDICLSFTAKIFIIGMHHNGAVL